jgi:hypothetical protein
LGTCTDEWSTPDEIVRVLGRLAEQTDNHALLPRSGGVDVVTVRSSDESGCIELVVEPRVAYVSRPKRLIFQPIDRSPKDSFFLLEPNTLAPSGVYAALPLDFEEVVETAPGEYKDREVWDRGYVDHDYRGRRIPLPNHARLISRILSGKILFVSNGSIWCSRPETYDGLHSEMTADQIRAAIKALLER